MRSSKSRQLRLYLVWEALFLYRVFHLRLGKWRAWFPIADTAGFYRTSPTLYGSTGLSQSTTCARLYILLGQLPSNRVTVLKPDTTSYSKHWQATVLKSYSIAYRKWWIQYQTVWTTHGFLWFTKLHRSLWWTHSASSFPHHSLS